MLQNNVFQSFELPSIISSFNHQELKKTSLTATRRKQLNNEIEAKEKEKWDYPQMAHTVSLFKIIDKGTKISSNKIHQDENVFLSSGWYAA